VATIESRVPGVFRSRAERKVQEAGYDPSRLPPGQYLTEKWPVLHGGDVPSYPADLAGWDFRVYGEVETPLTLDWKALSSLPTASVTQDIHCVTRWSRFDAEFTGVEWSTIRDLVMPRQSAHYAIAHAEAGFTSNVPLSSLEATGALLVTHADGEPLAPEHGWPLRLVVPGVYFWKSAKWLRAIELRATDAPGFWERYGYHNDADPWKEERYAF
jgi:DMSO/TMAO reductase YedYZ molybdopterin-dependent catalytic subunit